MEALTASGMGFVAADGKHLFTAALTEVLGR